jgi:phosphate transport system substrate-binding protein
MRSLLALVFCILFLYACNNSEPVKIVESTSEGTISISIEESFKPFMEQELKVFASSYPKAHIKVEYKSEIECLKDFAADSTRMIFVTRGLNKAEQVQFKNQLGYAPTFGILAYNAIAVVVNKNAKDSIFTLHDLQDRLTGKNPQQVVMDGNHLTGIVRFLKDSLVKADKLGKNVMAAQGSKEVIDYIKNNPNAIGFVGMNWIGDNYDPSQVADRLKLKMAKIECTLCAEKGLFASPSQATISLGQYSLSLPIYYILKENAPGLGSGLLNFMSLERGQLIFRRAFLVPAKMGFQKRNGIIN